MTWLHWLQRRDLARTRRKTESKTKSMIASPSTYTNWHRSGTGMKKVTFKVQYSTPMKPLNYTNKSHHCPSLLSTNHYRSPQSQLHDHLMAIIRQSSVFRPARCKARSYSLHPHSADYNHDSQLPNSPFGLPSTWCSEQAAVELRPTACVLVCVLVCVCSCAHALRPHCVHLHRCVNVCRAAAVFALCNPEWASIPQNDGCQGSTSVLSVTRRDTRPSSDVVWCNSIQRSDHGGLSFLHLYY